MNTKIIAGVVVVASLMASIGTTFAQSGNIVTSNPKPRFEGSGFGRGAEKLTEAERTQLASMTETQKKEFFETKRAEKRAEKEKYENVIDKLLKGEVLTAEEEALRAEIIQKRAEKQEKREKIKAIMEKKNSGQALTADEQAILDSMTQKDKMRPEREKSRRNATKSE